MSVEDYGRSLMAEVDEAPFEQFLQSLHKIYRPVEIERLGIPPLDRLLSLFANSSPLSLNTAAQGALQRPLATNRLDRPPVLEIASLEQCSGRTQLLYYITAHSILPKSFANIELPGREGAVVYIDTDAKFSVLRLHSILIQTFQSHLDEANPSSPLSPEEISSAILSSLDHVHVFCPASSQALLATLSNLPTYLLNTHSHKSSARPLATLIISNVGAFVWSDRRAPPSSCSTEPSPAILIQRFAELTASLRALHKQFSCTIVAGSWAFSNPKVTAYGGKELRPHLPPSWNDLCAVRVVVQREKVRKFGPGLSVEEAMMEGSKRWEAVQKAGWNGWLNWWGWEGWERRVLEGVREMKNGGAFEFKLNATGVQMWETGADDG